MSSLDDYLTDPLKCGVHYIQCTLDCSVLEQLFRHLGGLAKEKRMPSDELLRLADEIGRTETVGWDENELQEYLGRAISWFSHLDECPKVVYEYIFGHGIPEDLPRHVLGSFLEHRVLTSGRTYPERWESGIQAGRVFESRYFEDIGDVVSIETELSGTNLLLDAISVTEKGISRFRNFVKCIPLIGETCKEIKSRKASSSRYTFRPYPLVVQLWLDGETAKTIPEDIRDFLHGAVRYHREKEWRTSIVLSAIAVEVILADLYEEEFKEYAPNKPLGDLYHKLKDKIAFPQNIQKAIEIANDARISAVHRSRFPVSDREATNALFGAINFAVWNSSNF